MFHLSNNNNLYWSQKRSQSGSIHSSELDVYAVKQSALNFSFILSEDIPDRSFDPYPTLNGERT